MTHVSPMVVGAFRTLGALRVTAMLPTLSLNNIKYIGTNTKIKKIRNDQELIQSDPKICPRNQKRNT